MSLFQPDQFRGFVLSLPGVTVVEQWESLVAKVGGKVFALRGEQLGSITLRVSELAFAGLITLPDTGQAPYFAKGRWISLGPGCGLTGGELEGYLREAHRMIAAKLTRKARAELGLEA